MTWTRKSRPSQKRWYKNRHCFEHWYRDNQVYFITSRCRDRRAMFDSDEAKATFWDRFDHYTKTHRFTPWVTTLLNNHYHTLGYLRVGNELGEMMRKFHGSVAKLTNDLHQVRLVPFWVDHGQQDYFDGCIRNERQCRLAYRYTLTQAVRHGLARGWRDYVHTRVNVELDRGVKRALELRALLDGVPYRRYQRPAKDEPEPGH